MARPLGYNAKIRPKKDEVLEEAKGLITSDMFARLDIQLQHLILKMITLIEEKK
jgi:hypothetical protein